MSRPYFPSGWRRIGIRLSISEGVAVLLLFAGGEFGVDEREND